MARRDELSLATMLADPIVRDLMAADGVDSGELELQLRMVGDAWVVTTYLVANAVSLTGSRTLTLISLAAIPLALILRKVKLGGPATVAH
jgi:hypothetical protein